MSACSDETGAGSTSDASSGPVIGSLAGEPFVVRSASADTGWPPTDAGGGYPAVQIFLTSEDGTACSVVHPNSMALAMYVYNGRDQTPVGPGTYPMDGTTTSDGIFGEIVLWPYGSTCSDYTGTFFQDGGDVTSGTVTLTSLTPRVQGSFDVVTDGTHFAGSLDASLCPRMPFYGDCCEDEQSPNRCSN